MSGQSLASTTRGPPASKDCVEPMTPEPILQVLQRIREAANSTRHFPAIAMKSGDVEISYAAGQFTGVTLEPGGEVTISGELTLPKKQAGVDLTGDSLDVVINSLYPIDIEVDGRRIFGENTPVVAAGPALLRISDSLHTQPNPVLTATIRTPANQLMPFWVNVGMSTPRLRERFDVLDLMWAQLALAADLATPDEMEQVSAAAEMVPDDLDSPSTDHLREALQQAASALGPSSTRVEQLHVHAIGHCHIDLKWLWTWDNTVEVIRRDFASVVSMMNDYPEMCFTHSQPASYEVIRERDPHLLQEVKKLVAQGRWEPATMTWVEGDTNMASGEALAMQFTHGVNFTREHLGTSPEVLLLPDNFGHSANLPQLATSAGAKFFYHHRCNPGGVNRWPAYWWEGQDGSRLLSLSTSSYNGDISASSIAISAAEAYKSGLDTAMHFYGVGDHGGGPTRMSLDTFRALKGAPGMPSIACGTISGYAKHILDSGKDLPVHRGDLGFIFEGCYTTHSDTKRYNRMGENILTTADTLSAMAGVDRNADLERPWRTVAFNQFHDILDGSAIHEVYAEHRQDYEAVAAAATDVIDQALDSLTESAESDSVAVTNPIGVPRRDIVEVESPGADGEFVLDGPNGQTTGQRRNGRLTFVAEVGAFGGETYLLGTATDRPPVEIEEAYSAFAPKGGSAAFGSAASQQPPYFKVTTPHFVAYIRRDCGVIASLHDKRADRELVGFGMRRGSDYTDAARIDLGLNVLQLCREHDHPMSSWHMDEMWQETSLLRGAETSIANVGPVSSTIRIVHKLDDTEIRQEMTFYNDLPRIDVHTLIDWQHLGSPERGVPNLKVAFTLAGLTASAWAETPFGAVQRSTDGQEFPALRWADVGSDDYGLAIMNDCKYGYDAMGGRLRLTLVRSGYNPDAISDIGPHEMRYSIYPHLGTWREAGVVDEAAGFNQGLIATSGRRSLQANFAPQSGPGSVRIACLRPTPDGGRLIRLYETTGQPSSITISGLEGHSISESNIVGDVQSHLESDGSVTLTFDPWQVRTLHALGKEL